MQLLQQSHIKTRIHLVKTP